MADLAALGDGVVLRPVQAPWLAEDVDAVAESRPTS